MTPTKWIITAGSVATAAVAIFGALTFADSLVMSHEEHDDSMSLHVSAMHPVTEEAFAEIGRWNQCDRIERKIDTLQERLWAYREDAERVHQIKAELKKLEQRFTDLKCAEVLGA